MAVAMGFVQTSFAQINVATAYTNNGGFSSAYTYDTTTPIPMKHRITEVKFVSTSLSTLTIRPTRFFGQINSTEFAPDSYFIMPRFVDIPVPFCATALPSIQSVVGDVPPGCYTGELFYGMHAISVSQAGFPSVPFVNASDLNGPDFAPILGMNVAAVDGGGIYKTRGVVTYYPNGYRPRSESPLPFTCEFINPLFEATIALGGMFDNTIIPYPIGYTSYSQLGPPDYITTLWTTSWGLDCSTLTRAPNTPAILPTLRIVPVCKASTPANYTGLSPTLYNQVFGTGFIGPTNVGLNGIVYQLRVDNFAPQLKVRFHISFTYLDGASTNFTEDVSFPYIFYVASTGQTPALVRTCFYEETVNTCASFDTVYSEADLFQLAPCNCGAPTTTIGNTLVCDPLTNETLLEVPLNRSTIPYFSSPIPTSLAPTCVFVINSENNQTAPFSQIPFSLMDLSSGGVAPLTFGWRFVGAPPSTASIVPPGTGSTAMAQVATPGFYTVEHAVTDGNGIFTQCSRTFEVAGNAIVVCVQPTGPDLILTVGQVQPLDASCTFNPLGTPVSFSWNVSTFTVNTPITITSNTGATTSILAQQPGNAIIILTATNGVSTRSTALYIRVTLPVPPSTPSTVPFGTPIPPALSCFPNSTPVDVPVAKPPPTVPIGNFPVGPQSPMDVNPSGASPSSGLIGPDGKIPEGVLIFVPAVFLAVIFVCLAVQCAYSIARERERIGWFEMKRIV